MIGITLFGVFLTPVFYYVLERLGDGLRKPPDERAGSDTIAAPDATGARSPRCRRLGHAGVRLEDEPRSENETSAGSDPSAWSADRPTLSCGTSRSVRFTRPRRGDFRLGRGSARHHAGEWSGFPQGGRDSSHRPITPAARRPRACTKDGSSADRHGRLLHARHHCFRSGAL